jgi:arylsulfatase A-like enzyme
VRVASAAGPLDIAPTIASWAGIADAASRVDGIDLRWQAAEPPGALASRVVVTETPRNANEPFFLAWSATEGRMHLVYDVVGPRVELFDMDADPFESHNLAAERPEETARMMGLLGRWLDRMSERPGFSGWAQMQPAVWSPAPKFPPAPPHEDIRDKVGGDDDDDE